MPIRQSSVNGPSVLSCAGFYALAAKPAPRESATALQRIRGARARAHSYLDPAPRLRRLKYLTDVSGAEASPPKTAVLPRLAFIVIRSVTSLDPLAYTRLSGRAQFPTACLRCRFRGAETRSFPLPTASGRHNAVRLRLRTDLPTSPYGPLTVELFTVDGFAVHRRASSAPDRPRRRGASSLRRRALHEPEGPNPTRRICVESTAQTLTCFDERDSNIEYDL